MKAGEVVLFGAVVACLLWAILFWAASDWWSHQEYETYGEAYEKRPWYVRLCGRLLGE